MFEITSHNVSSSPKKHNLGGVCYLYQSDTDTQSPDTCEDLHINSRSSASARVLSNRNLLRAWSSSVYLNSDAKWDRVHAAAVTPTDM